MRTVRTVPSPCWLRVRGAARASYFSACSYTSRTSQALRVRLRRHDYFFYRYPKKHTSARELVELRACSCSVFSVSQAFYVAIEKTRASFLYFSTLIVYSSVLGLRGWNQAYVVPPVVPTFVSFRCINTTVYTTLSPTDELREKDWNSCVKFVLQNSDIWHKKCNSLCNAWVKLDSPVVKAGLEILCCSAVGPVLLAISNGVNEVYPTWLWIVPDSQLLYSYSIGETLYTAFKIPHGRCIIRPEWNSPICSRSSRDQNEDFSKKKKKKKKNETNFTIREQMVHILNI